MALVAVDFTVLALQRKVGLIIMIEGPQQPGVRVVAAAALLAHATLVGFIGFMARETGGFGLLEFGIQMAGFTSRHTMNTYQRETGDVMFEKELYVPALFIMTIAAIFTRFSPAGPIQAI